jgi:hypothetical protein
MIMASPPRLKRNFRSAPLNGLRDGGGVLVRLEIDAVRIPVFTDIHMTVPMGGQV